MLGGTFLIDGEGSNVYGRGRSRVASLLKFEAARSGRTAVRLASDTSCFVLEAAGAVGKDPDPAHRRTLSIVRLTEIISVHFFGRAGTENEEGPSKSTETLKS